MLAACDHQKTCNTRGAVRLNRNKPILTNMVLSLVSIRIAILWHIAQQKKIEKKISNVFDQRCNGRVHSSVQPDLTIHLAQLNHDVKKKN